MPLFKRFAQWTDGIDAAIGRYEADVARLAEGISRADGGTETI